MRYVVVWYIGTVNMCGKGRFTQTYASQLNVHVHVSARVRQGSNKICFARRRPGGGLYNHMPRTSIWLTQRYGIRNQMTQVLDGSRPMTIDMANFVALPPIYGGSARRWQLSCNSPGIQRLPDVQLPTHGGGVIVGSFEAILAAQSISLFVVPGNWIPAPPSPPLPQSPPPVGPPPFTTSAETSPQTGVEIEATVTIVASTILTGGRTDRYIVNVEIALVEGGEKVFQEFETFSFFEVGASVTLEYVWTPAADGMYKVSVAVFSADWATNYGWNDRAAEILVGTV